MKGHAVSALLLALPLALGTLSCAGPGEIDSFALRIDARSAPPPPRIVYEEHPVLEEVPGMSVYIVDQPDYDLFLCQGSYYLSANGYWYRASRQDGPYVAVDGRAVPREVLSVPAERWKHHPHGMPPGQAKKGWS